MLQGSIIIAIDTSPWVANISILFQEFPLLERPAAAKFAGFSLVEAWWPFPTATPSDDDVDAFVSALEAAGVTLTGLNFYAGDMPGGDRGVASIPARHDELLSSFPALSTIAERTGVRAFNLLYGQTAEGVTDEDQLAAGIRSLIAASDLVEPWGGTVLLEPLASGLNGDYPLLTDADVIAVLDAANAAAGRTLRTALLFDLFHLGSNGVDLVDAARRLGATVGHVQVADSPGRGEPGSGSLPIRETLDALRTAGYTGPFAAEYKPTTETGRSLGWMETLS